MDYCTVGFHFGVFIFVVYELILELNKYMYYKVSQNVIKVFEYQSYIFVHFDTWPWENFTGFKMRLLGQGEI